MLINPYIHAAGSSGPVLLAADDFSSMSSGVDLSGRVTPTGGFTWTINSGMTTKSLTRHATAGVYSTGGHAGNYINIGAAPSILQVKAEVLAIGSGSYPYVYLSFVDSNNHVHLFLNSAANTVYLDRKVGGANGTIGTFALSGASMPGVYTLTSRPGTSSGRHYTVEKAGSGTIIDVDNYATNISDSDLRYPALRCYQTNTRIGNFEVWQL